MSLKKQAIGGVKWTTASTVIVSMLQLAQMSILARFLEPGDFGLMAIMMVVIGFSQAFQDMGISNAIIQRQEISHTQLSSLYWLNIAAGAVLTLIVIAIAPLVAMFYEEPRITSLMILLSSTFILVAIGNQYRVLCQKNMNFRTMEIINVSTSIVSLVVAAVMAYKGYGVLTLVCAMITQAALSSLLFLWIGLRYYHKPSLIYKHSELEGFYGFGMYQMGERSINYIGANADKVLIGKLVGVEAVGFYNLAWQLVIFPVSKINPIVNKIAFPLYSRIQSNPDALNRYYYIVVKALSLVTIPLLTFLIFFSDEIVEIVFGKGWSTTAEIIPILAVIGILRAVGNPGGAAILAKGRANIGFWWNLFWSSVIVLGLLISLSISPSLDTAIYVLLILYLTVGMLWHVVIKRYGEVSYRNIIKHLIRLCTIIFSIGFLVSTFVDIFNINSSFIKVIIGSLLCGTIYLLYLYILEKDFIYSLRK
ncbi:MOP flippase family protein [Psychrobacter pocilloporae]|uniref:MOP flippase family protein n=1 Tax=Psychrobacter pocilloporae TaxID=1775882 RepID=UPI003C2E95FD